MLQMTILLVYTLEGVGGCCRVVTILEYKSHVRCQFKI